MTESRSRTIAFFALLAAGLAACGSAGDGGRATGGAVGTGGTQNTGAGGSAATGGTRATGGASGSTGGAAGVAGAAGAGAAGHGGSAGAAGAGAGQGGSAGAAGGAAGQGGAAGAGGAAGYGGAAGHAAGGAGGAGGVGGASQRSIAFGTLLDAQAQITESQALAKALAKPGSSQWQAKGDQHRTYHFPTANADVPYRLCVPTSWDGKSNLSLVMFLHGANNDESSYLDQNNKQMVNLAAQHGVVLVSPLGYQGAYGNFLRLPATFGDPTDAATQIAAITASSEHDNELSEKDVINVLEIVLAEYPIDRSAVFLTGHSMGSGGTWYIGAKYSGYWAALAPMSGPFVQQTGYPWDNLRPMSIFITEGTQAPTLSASRALRDWMLAGGFTVKYEEVNADHPGMVPLVLPDVFTFFDKVRNP